MVQWFFIGYSGKLWMCEVSCQQYGIPGKILLAYVLLISFTFSSVNELDRSRVFAYELHSKLALF